MPPRLRRELFRLRRVLKVHRALRHAVWSLAVLLALLDLAFIALRVRPLIHQRTLLLIGLVATILVPFLVALLALLWPVPWEDDLRYLDRRLHLSDRLTTAWELAQGRIEAPASMRRLQFEETMHHLARVEPQRHLPLRPPRPALHVLILLLALLIPLLTLPNPQEAVLAERERLEAITEETSRQLEETMQQLERDSRLDEATRREAEMILAEAMARLTDPQATLEEKVSALTEAERRLAALQSPQAEALQRHLSEAAPLSTEAVVRPLSEALERGDIEAAADYLRALADNEEGRLLTEAEQVALADALTEMADQLAESEPAMAEALSRAAEALYNGDAEQAKEALRQASSALDEAAQQQAPNEALQEAQAQLQEARTQLAQVSGESQPMLGEAGEQANDGTAAQQTGGEGNAAESGVGSSAPGHHEDSGSSTPYGAEQARLEAESESITIPRKELPEGFTSVSHPAPPGQTRVPYREIYSAYRREAEATLSREPLPPALRTYVRTYFASLEP